MPETRLGKRLYAVSIGVLGALLIAPQQTEFQSKVALLGSLTIICAARPVVILLREAAARSSRDTFLARPGRQWREPCARCRAAARAAAPSTLLAAASFAGLLVLAGTPARSSAGIADLAGRALAAEGHVAPSPGVVEINRPRRGRSPLTWFSTSREEPRLPHRADRLERRAGAGPGTARRRRDAHRRRRTRPRDAAPRRSTVRASRSCSDSGARTVVVAKPRAQRAGHALARAAEGQPGVRAARGLKDVAPAGGPELPAGRVPLLDVGRAAGDDGRRRLLARLQQRRLDGSLRRQLVLGREPARTGRQRAGLPRSALFENEHGKFVNVTKSSGAGMPGSGHRLRRRRLQRRRLHRPARHDGDRRRPALEQRQRDVHRGRTRRRDRPRYAWHSGAAVADVNGDGRPDLFIAGYTNMLEPIATSIAGFPTNYQGVRDELFLNEGNDKNGRAHFREVGVQAGLDPAAVRPQSRRRLHRRER